MVAGLLSSPRSGVGRPVRLLALLVALAAFAVLVGAHAPDARAGGPYTINADCPNRLLQPYNSANYRDRCMGSLYSMTQVGAGSWYSYNRCAIAKYNSDGSGGDAFTAMCGTATITVTPCYNPSFKYPGVVDHGPNAHTGYWGQFVTSTSDC